MKTYMTPEEHARLHRRRARQTLGLLIAVLALVGIVTVVRAGVKGVATLFDDTQQKAEYEDRLEGLVLFDPLPFDGIENIDDLTLREPPSGAACTASRRPREALITTTRTLTPNSCCCPRWMWMPIWQSWWAPASS